MKRDAPQAKGGKQAAREDRLKAALKANLGRRKSQARARNGDMDKTAEARGAQAKDTS